MNTALCKESYDRKIKRVLITEQQIKDRIKEVAAQVNEEYKSKPLMLVSILNGAFVFMADFCRAIEIPCEIAFMKAKSYYDTTESSGNVTITMDIPKDIANYNVIIVEDIIDTGRTLKEVVGILKSRNPLSLSVITLLDKPARRLVEFEADTALFTIDDYFVIGYGLDCAELYRNLPYIAEYSEEE
ncbi:MAG: hypoxanthine phosphoribosyltransferase [Oscillospiraceae bacterium]|nr:hypoxanthine phosphoribosyltransferase [Oscillospiraceae bacterium]